MTDFQQKPPSLEEYWTPESLQIWIMKVAYHSQGHKRQCKCPWCMAGENLLIILESRPDLMHWPESEGGDCRTRCHHVRRVGS